jgi:hypothetical protein
VARVAGSVEDQIMTKKKLAIVRTVTMWGSYDPTRKEISHLAKYKYGVPVRTGCHVIQLKGYYVPERK